MPSASEPIEVAYQTYLRAELAKLRNAGDAADFLARSGCAVASLEPQVTVAALMGAFNDQALVDDFVDRLDLAGKRKIAECCQTWRRNGVASKLAAARRATLETVPIEQLLLGGAESKFEYRLLWARNGQRLVAIAADPELGMLPPYRDWLPNQAVEITRCLVEPDSFDSDAYKVIDGIHRAIQLVWNGATALDLCVLRQ